MNTLKELRSSGSLLKIECVRCGDIEYRAPATLEGPGNRSLGELALGFTCRDCGASACFASAEAPPPAG